MLLGVPLVHVMLLGVPLVHVMLGPASCEA